MNAKLRIRLFFANVLFLIFVLFIARGSPARAFAAFATGVVFSLVLARYISSHVEGLTNDVSIALRKVTAGDFSQRLPISGDEDIAVLGASFNAMTQAFGSSILKLQEARREAESVVAAMSEGVIVLDRYGRITFANASFRSLLDGDHPDPLGKSLLEVFRLPELENSVRTRLVGEPRIVEFSFNGGRLLQAHVAALSNEESGQGSAVVLFHDVTAIRRAESMRRDFVANVSHEFKTPLASILGYAETLLNGGLNDKHASKDFVGAMDRNARHLESLVNDMLALARLEAEVPLLREPVSVQELIDEQLALRGNAISARELRVSVDCSEFEIHADRSRLATAISNLIDNAIKYNSPGGEIRICGALEKDVFVLSISDAGQGIPGSDLGRIFERFYRVDKARARESGGTGLGLAIVKHAVESQGGTIQVTSVLGLGTTFTMRLPSRV